LEVKQRNADETHERYLPLNVEDDLFFGQLGEDYHRD
jgi:hypothetical protein